MNTTARYTDSHPLLGTTGASISSLTCNNGTGLVNTPQSYIQTSTLNTFAPVSGNDNLTSTIQKQTKMTPKQINVAVFTITRDKDTNEINSTKFVKELWIEQKNGTSIDLIVAKQLGEDFDPELTIIKTLSTVSF